MCETDFRAALTHDVMALYRALGQPLHWIDAARLANQLCDDPEAARAMRDRLAEFVAECAAVMEAES